MKKFLKFEPIEDSDVKEMYPDVLFWVMNNKQEELCQVKENVRFGRRNRTVAAFEDGFSQIYMTSECLRQVADKLDSLEKEGSHGKS